MQTDFAVTAEDVKAVAPHPNADRLDIITVLGWQVIAGKGQYQVGDTCIYFPIDSLLPEALEDLIFAGSKLRLNKSRVKTIRLRGALSQGLAVKPETIGLNARELRIGEDLTEVLGVQRWMPPRRSVKGLSGPAKKLIRRLENPNFHVYEKFPRIQNVPGLFTEDDVVVVSEKIHGSNFRAGWVKFYPQTWWQKIKKFIGLAPEWEFVYGSHRVQYCYRKYNGYYKQNIYLEMVEKYDLRNRIPKGIVIYGEVYGDGIQKDYLYGCGPDERKLMMFDAKVDGQYIPFMAMFNYADAIGLEVPPTLYAGTFNETMVAEYVSGPSQLGPQMIREGIVIREIEKGNARRIAKWINPDYLMDKSSEEATDFEH